MATPVAGSVPFDEAIRFFQAKLGNLLPSRTWTDTYGRINSIGFAVAGAQKTELLQSLHGAVLKALRDGTTLADFRRDFAEIVKRTGWSYRGEFGWRTRTVFETNLRSAYAAGKWAQAQETRGEFPFVRYVAVLDERTRPDHRRWHGTILPVGDAWWRTHWPPNGWGCRCTIQQVNDRDLKRNGWVVQPEGPRDPVVTKPIRDIDGTGVATVPRGIDPGFEFNPGDTWLRPYTPRPESATGPVGEALPRVAPAARPGIDPPAPRPGIDPAPAPDQLRIAAGDALLLAAAALRAADPLPPPRPMPRSVLLGEGLSDQALVEAFMAEFGGSLREAVVHIDVTGEPLTISPALFQQRDGGLKVMKRGRGRLLRLLAEAVKAPDEIWLVPVRLAGRTSLRRRYIARFEIDGEAQPALVVFEWRLDTWAGVTAFGPDEEEYLEDQRTGERPYRRRDR